MRLLVKHFHSTTHVKNVLMTQLQYTREFMRSIKKHRNAVILGLLVALQVGKLAGIHLQKMILTSQISPPILPSKAVPSSITVADEETLRTNTYTRAVR